MCRRLILSARPRRVRACKMLGRRAPPNSPLTESHDDASSRSPSPAKQRAEMPSPGGSGREVPSLAIGLIELSNPLNQTGCQCATRAALNCAPTGR